MTPETKQLALEGLRRLRGDDYERAQSAFRNLTPTEMQLQHGESGHTREEILTGYRDHVKRVEKAIAEVQRA